MKGFKQAEVYVEKRGVIKCDVAFENGIITADSMSARGYGVRKRTEYKIYKFFFMF